VSAGGEAVGAGNVPTPGSPSAGVPAVPPPTAATDALLTRMASQLEELTEETRRSRERWEVLDELVRDATPVMRQLLGSATTRLATLEARGYAEFVGGGLGVVDRVVGAFDRDDIDALGDNVVLMLQTVRDMTQPEVLGLLRRTAADLHDDGAAPPPSLLTLLGRLRRPEARRGLDRLLRLLENVGGASPHDVHPPKEGPA
jgi:uncharacterized protein YjgD (DUF1641 family)